MSIKEHVQGKVTFQYYRDNQLFYKTDSGLIFPVPLDPTEKVTFLAEDKALLFMRYIRKHLESMQSGAV